MMQGTFWMYFLCVCFGGVFLVVVIVVLFCFCFCVCVAGFFFFFFSITRVTASSWQCFLLYLRDLNQYLVQAKP